MMYVTSLDGLLCMLVLVLLSVSSISLEQPSILDDIFRQSTSLEEECISAVVDGASLNSRHISLAMRRSWWACTKAILEVGTSTGLDARNEFDLQSRNILKEINNLKAVLESSRPIQSIATAFQWAQSGSEVFINAKFAHKLDAPATLDVTADNVTLTEHSLTLRASKDSKRFTLDLGFYDEIDPESSTWSFASVGRITFTLKKKGAPSVWPRLLKSKQKLANMHFWWELADQYEDELESIAEKKNESNKTKKQESSSPATGEGNNNNNDGNQSDNTSSNDAAPPRKQLTEKAKKIKAIERDLKMAIEGLEEDNRSKRRQADMQARLDKQQLDKVFQETKKRLENEAEEKKKQVMAEYAQEEL